MKTQISTDENLELFEKKEILQKDLPLAVRMRPQTLDEFVGQEHILGKGKLLRRAIEADKLISLILYGPPGVGKTSLAWCIKNITKSEFLRINATSSNVDELRKVISQAVNRKRMAGIKTILFIDEIHRFNKAQQDVLMPDLEEGNFILIGATTHNPFFYLVSTLISRSLIFELKPLTEIEILTILKNALRDKGRGLGNLKIKIKKSVLRFLAKNCESDARRALNALEIGALTGERDKDGFINFDLELAQNAIQKKSILYDRSEDLHYDTISAFIKSMRGSDPDATLYWLAKMLYAGEDPRFIARRICICAAEDVGNADPQALVLANSALSVAEFVGLPEAKIPLAQAAIYVACAPKSNASYLAIEKAYKDVEDEKTFEVPNSLKNSHYPGAKILKKGVGYKYPHDYKTGYLKQDYLPKKKRYYEPKDSGYEARIKKRLEEFQKETRPTESGYPELPETRKK